MRAPQNLSFEVYQKTCDSLMESAHEREPTVLARTSYSLLAIFWYARPEAAPPFDYGAPLITRRTLCTDTSRQAVRQQRSQGIQGCAVRGRGYQPDEARADVTWAGRAAGRREML